MKKIKFALALIGLASMFSANAASLTSSLDLISSPDIGTGSLGVVTVTQTSSKTVEFNVTLAPNTAFVSTGDHRAFGFNLNLTTPFTVSFNNPVGGIFAYAGGPANNVPYGSFANTIKCPGCGHGASHAYSGVLDFTITDDTGISLSNIIGNADGYYFSADVIGPLGGTGVIAGTLMAPVAPVPEPQTYAMLLAGLGLIGFSVRRRKYFN